MTLGMNSSNEQYPEVEEYTEEEMIEMDEDVVEAPPIGIDKSYPPPPPPPPPRRNQEIGIKLTANKMNVFYIGVDNPMSVSVAGTPNSQLKVSCSGCSIKGSNGKYTVRVERAGSVQITVTANGVNQSFDYRAKRIPDPVAVLGAGPNKRGGAMGVGEFKAQRGVAGLLTNFDFDAKCSMTYFEITRLNKTDDIVTIKNKGARYTNEAQSLVAKAVPGDTYIMDSIRCKCPGDAAERALTSLVFNLK